MTGDSYVFRSDGVFRAPGPCETYWWLIGKRDALYVKARAAASEQQCIQLTAQADDTRRAIGAHIQICDDCGAWLDAISHEGRGLVRCSEEEAARVWAAIDRGGRQ